MRRPTPAALALLCAVSAFAAKPDFAPPKAAELSMKDVAIAPGASAAILEWDFRQDDQKARTTEYYRIKILTDEGKKYGDIEIPFAPGFSVIRDLAARTVQPDGTIVPFTGQPFDKLLVKYGRRRYMVKTFSMPQVQAGSIVEVRYTRTWPERYLLPSTAWEVQRDIPVLVARLWLKPIISDWSSYFTYVALPPGKRPEWSRDHFALELTNVPAFVSEPYAPPSAQLRTRIDFYYRQGHVDPEQYWAETGKKSAAAVNKFIGAMTLPADISAEATPEAKLRKSYAYVQSLRNLSFEATTLEKLTELEKLPKNDSVSDVMSRRFGWGNDLTRVFVAMARAAGFEADVVRVGPREERFITRDVPDEEQLTDEIAVVVIDGKTRWFDPSTPYAPFGMLPWAKTSIPGLRLAKGGAVWVDIPKQPIDAAVTKRRAELQIEEDVLKGTVVATFSGQEALSKRAKRRYDGEAAAKKEIEDDLKATLPEGAQVKISAIEGLDALDEALTVKADVEIGGLAARTGARMLVPMSIFGGSRRNPFSSEARKHELHFPYGRRSEEEVVIRLPKGWAVEALPKNTVQNKNLFSFRHETKSDGSAVTLTRKLTIQEAFLSAEDYSIVRSFFGTVAAADEETLILKEVK